jgi:hypothetical protein
MYKQYPCQDVLFLAILFANANTDIPIVAEHETNRWIQI